MSKANKLIYAFSLIMITKLGSYFLLIIFLFVSFGCDKKEEVTCIMDCMETYLEQNKMVSYKGGEIGCKNFVSLYQYQNKQYFVLGNHCADIASNPIDCNGKTVCGSGNELVCNELFKNAKYIGIVGIEQ
ncbi:hypothetical protein [Adhaeribacter aquaticus]|uniref:hypothetical protein n=1 Tax=Adhaeribacter aquaticus TaxID=299567 RepID=UPI0012FC595A|nr:hypothetical protein [Adhaeribacter aquaticus]